MRQFNLRIFAALLCLSLTMLIFTGCASQSQQNDVMSTPAKGKVPAPPPAPAPEINEAAYDHFVNATIYEQEHAFDAAVREYEQALSYEPTSYDIRLSLGVLYLNLNRPSQALETLLPIKGKDSKVYGLMGDAFRELGQHEKAEAAYQQGWEQDSTDVNFNYNLGLYAAQANDINRAGSYFRRAAQYSMNADLFERIAEMYAGSQMYDSAAAFMKSSLDLDQNNPQKYGQYALYLHQAGHHEAAKQALSRGITLHPRDPLLLAQLLESYNIEDNKDSVRIVADRILSLKDDELDIDVLQRIAIVLMRENMPDVAQRFFDKILSVDAENRYALFYLGRYAIQQENYDSARVYFDHLIAADSTVPDGWTNLAFILQRQEMPDSAMKVLETALGQVRDDQNNIRLFMAQLLSEKQMSDSAIVVLRQVVENGGDTVRALFQTGAEYEKLGEFDKAVEAFELLLSLNPHHHPTLNYLGYMLADKGERLDEALVMIEKAVGAEPDNGAYLDSYAWVLYKLGRYSEALAQIRKAVTLVPDDPVVTEHLGDIHAALGHTEEARDAWSKALAADPENAVLQAKLKR